MAKCSWCGNDAPQLFFGLCRTCSEVDVKTDITKKELEDLIKYHQDKYYNGQPEISDPEFDLLWDELKEKYPDSKLLKKVGETSWEGFQKAKHVIFMCSQQKASNVEEFEKWNREQNQDYYIVETKCDGISLAIEYKDGKFVKALTRGDGTVGDDISNNVRKMNGFKEKIDKYFTGAVRCEIVMLRSVFENKYKVFMKNPRNAASGISKSKEGDNCNDLDLIYYDAKLTNEHSFNDEIDKLKFLERNFRNYVVEYQRTNKDKVTDLRNDIMQHRDRIPYDIDGLVIKTIEIDPEDMERATPKKQIAYKFDTEKVHTKLLNVEWSESGTYFTPVGIVEAVELNGTTVRRASFANMSLLKEMGVQIGDIVEITKRGEIIPKIERVISKTINSKNIEYPTECSCGSKLHDDGIFIFCPNKNCHKKKLYRIIKWVNVLDIKFLGIVMIETLFQNGLIRNISDLYTCDLEKVIKVMEKVEGFSRNNITRAFESLYKTKQITLSKFLGGYNIGGVGERVIEIIIENSNGKFEKLDDFLNTNSNELSSIKQIGLKKASQILEGISDNIKDMQKSLNSGKIDIIEIKRSSNKLNGLSFCITGKLNKGKRDDYIDIIKDNGGTYKGVDKTLTYLINNDNTSTSGKNEKAHKLGIKIITEDEFLELIK